MVETLTEDELKVMLFILASSEFLVSIVTVNNKGAIV